MNLPWDKSYFKACFYAIFTFICIYIVKKLIDAAAYAFVNIDDMYSLVFNTLGRFCSVFSILILGFIIAYILKPAVNMVENKTGLKRGKAAALVFIVFIISLSLIIGITAYSIDYSSLSYTIMDYGDNINEIYSGIRGFLSSLRLVYVEEALDNITGNSSEIIRRFCGDLLGISKKIFSRTVTILISTVVAFYMLKDEEKITGALSRYAYAIISPKWNKRIRLFLGDINKVFSRYLRGQLTDGAIMAGLISLGLALIKVPFSVIIGIMSGFSNIIPYFGSILGFVLSVGMALISGEPVRAVYAAVIVLVLQQIDTVFIVPKIVGDSVRLNPVMIIISLSVAGKLFGIVGMIFAVPLVAFIKLRLDRFCERREEYGEVCREGIVEDQDKRKKP